MKIKTLIIDDEPLARDRLRSLLQEQSDIQLSGECSDGREAVTTIRNERPDLVFLDVQMPELDGFGVLKELAGERLPAVIFVTAHDKFALRAFEVHAVDYLLKPFDRDRFQTALRRALNQIKHHQTGELSQRLTALLAEVKSEPKHLERLAIKASGRVIFLKTD